MHGDGDGGMTGGDDWDGGDEGGGVQQLGGGGGGGGVQPCDRNRPTAVHMTNTASRLLNAAVERVPSPRCPPLCPKRRK